MAQVVAKMSLRLKRTQSAFGSCWSGYEFLTEKSLPEPEIKVHLEIHVTLRSVLLDFQLFTEKHVFWVCFRSCYDISFSHLVGNSMNRGSVICKLAKKWYLIRICASWLCPFNKGTQTEIVNLDGRQLTTTEHPGGLPYEKVGVACPKFLIKALKLRRPVSEWLRSLCDP